MMDFKVIFPAGYRVENILNHNIDVNIILENSEVYFGTLFTLLNVQYLLNKDNEPCFWATDMLLVKDLSQNTIRESIALMIKNQCIEEAFTRIGTVYEIYGVSNFEGIVDMEAGYNIG
jgi:uncharacterized membrane protein